MFLFAAAYPDVAAAEGDYEVIRVLHSCGEIGPYDAAVIGSRGDALAVHKSAGLGPALRALLEDSRAALVVVGSDEDAARIQQAAAEATSSILTQSSSPEAPFTDR